MTVPQTTIESAVRPTRLNWQFLPAANGALSPALVFHLIEG